MKKELTTEKRQLRYVVAHEQIKSIIAEEGLRPGDKLPGENDLAEKLGVSRGTLRQALMLLRESGIIYNHQGKGNFLCDTDKSAAGLEQAACDLMQFVTVPVDKRNLTVEYVPSTKTVQKYLERSETTLLARFQLLYCHGQEAVAYRAVFVPYEMLEEKKVDLDSKEELLAFIDACLQNQVAAAQMTINQVEARESVAEKLAAKTGTYLFCLSEIGRDKTGTALFYSKFYCYPEYFKFVVSRT